MQIPEHKIDYFKTITLSVMVILLLYWGQPLFIPLGFAVFVSFVLYPVCRWLIRKGVSEGVAISLSLLLVIVPFAGLMLLFIRQMIVFREKIPKLQEKIPLAFNKVIQLLSELLEIPVLKLKAWMNESLAGSLDLVSILKQTVAVSSVSLVLALLIPVYVVLIIKYRKSLLFAISLLFPQLKFDTLKTMVNDTSTTYYSFIKGMLLVYLIVGLLNSAGLWLLGIPSPVFFGFIASILTIIPYVGIMVGAVVPITIAWIEHDSIWYPLGVIGVFSIVQVLEANVIFPIAVGQRLRLNPLFVLLAVIAGGLIWGVSGMILFIPLMGVLKLISDRIPSLYALSALLEGKITDKIN